MNPIKQALNLGKSANQILKYLSASDPQLADKISKAIAAGYSVEKVLNFIMKNGNKASNLLPEDKEYEKQRMYKSKKQFSQADKNLVKTGIAAATTALGSYAASRLGSMAAQSITPEVLPALSQQPTQLTQPIDPQAPIQGLSPEINIDQEIKESVLPSKPNKGFETIKNSLLGPIFDKIPKLEANDSKKIAQKLEMGKVVSELEKSTGEKIEDLTQQYIEERNRKQNELPVEEVKQNRKMTASGDIAEVENQTPNTSKVKIDGQSKIVKNDNLIDMPENEIELANAFDDLIGKIEKHTGRPVSRHVDLISYDENSGILTYKPWNKEIYGYDNISKDKVEELKKNILRKTSGEMFIGAWESGTGSPIGAQMSQFLQKLKKERGDKGYLFKVSDVYSALKPASEASEKKYKLKKKKMKDERKKRRV